MEVTIYSELLGKSFSRVKRVRSNSHLGEDELHFINIGDSFKFTHYQECCEKVYIESITGDLSDLENLPLVEAEEVTEVLFYPDIGWKTTYTFYKFRTAKGCVTIRWCGESSDDYSQRVHIEQYTRRELPIN